VDTTSDFLIEAGISPEVVALVPGSVALENVLLPFSATEDTIRILFAEPPDEELLQKLAFILQREVTPALARRVAILAAIDHYYVRSAYESVPAMLVSTTDWKLRCNVEED
jgi:type IV pilus assembly protein PilB